MNLDQRFYRRINQYIRSYWLYYFRLFNDDDAGLNLPEFPCTYIFLLILEDEGIILDLETGLLAWTQRQENNGWKRSFSRFYQTEIGQKIFYVMGMYLWMFYGNGLDERYQISPKSIKDFIDAPKIINR